jgi:hypothetical protein
MQRFFSTHGFLLPNAKKRIVATKHGLILVGAFSLGITKKSVAVSGTSFWRHIAPKP